MDRSERTVRRWESTEGLPVHRREHEKQDTVFAYKHELEAWSRLRTKSPDAIEVREADSLSTVKSPTNTYLAEHDAITRTMHCYIEGARAGDGDLMRPAFILWQPFPAIAKESNTAGPLSTCSNG